MLRVTLRGLRAHSFRLVATALAVVLGVAFMAGTFVLTDTIRTSFDRLFADVNAGTDVLVRAKSPFEGGTFGTERPRVPTALVERVAAVPGVAAAAGRVQGYAQIVGTEGKVLGGTRAPTFGYAWIAAPGLSPSRLAEGTAPAAPDDVVLDRASRSEGHLAVGDRVHILVKDGAEDFRITGFATFGSADRPLGATAALFRPDTAQRLLGEAGQFDAVVAEARAGTTQVALQRAVEGALADPALEVVTGAAATAESQGQVAERLKFFTTSLLLFAGVSLFVGTFIIYNTFTVVVAQRARELALLRAIGAGRTQVLRSVLLEAVIVGVVASVIGVIGGIGVAAGLRSLLAAVGFRLPAEGLVLAARTVVVSLAVGVVVTGGSALFPARRAAGVAPLAALREVEVEPPAHGRARLAIGVALLGAGTALILAGSLRGGAGLRY